MKTAVSLDSKDVKLIIARFLGIPVENVLPNKYSFSVVGINAAEIEKKINGEELHNEGN